MNKSSIYFVEALDRSYSDGGYKFIDEVDIIRMSSCSLKI